MSIQDEPDSSNSIDDGVALPFELTVLFEPMECKLCHVKATSSASAYAHYEGKTHSKNVNKFLQENFNVGHQYKKARSEFKATTCEVCSVTLSSAIQAQLHYNGKMHAKNVKNPQIIWSAATVSGAEEEGTCVGENNGEEGETTDDWPYCEICDIYCNTEQQMEMHKTGSRHTKNMAYLASLVREEAKKSEVSAKLDNETLCSVNSINGDCNPKPPPPTQTMCPTNNTVMTPQTNSISSTAAPAYQPYVGSDPMALFAQALTSLVTGALGQTQMGYQPLSVPTMVPYQQPYQYQGVYCPPNANLSYPTLFASGAYGHEQGGTKKLKISDVRDWLPFYKNSKGLYECIACNKTVKTPDKFVEHLNSGSHRESMIKYNT